VGDDEGTNRVDYESTAALQEAVDTLGSHCRSPRQPRSDEPVSSLYITRGMVSVRSSVTLGVASSVANDVIMKMTS